MQTIGGSTNTTWAAFHALLLPFKMHTKEYHIYFMIIILIINMHVYIIKLKQKKCSLEFMITDQRSGFTDLSSIVG